MLFYLRQVAEGEVVRVLGLWPVAPSKAQVTLVRSCIKGGDSIIVWLTVLKVVHSLLPGQSGVPVEGKPYYCKF